MPILAVTILALALLDLVLSLFLSRGFLHESELALGARVLLLGYAIAVLSTISWAIGTGALWALRLNRRGSAFYRCMQIFFKAALAALLFFYVLSWATFWQVGRFLDGEALRFWWVQPLQVFHWIDLDVGAVVIGAALLIGLALFGGLPRWCRRWSAAAQNRVVQLSKAAFAIGLFCALLGGIYSGRTEEAHLRASMLYSRARDELSTPLAHLFANVRSAWLSRPDEFQRSEPPKLIQRPILPMEKYLGSVDRNKIKPWNVIVIVVESLRADQLRAYGAGRDIMPRLDALARQSRVFTNTRSQSSQTSYAVLAPLSAHYPLRSATQYAYPENPSYPRVLLHDVLKNLGYRTAVFSSSNENWEGMIHYLQTGNIDHLFHASVFKGETYLSPGDTFFGNWVMATRHAGSVDDRFTIDEALQWVDQTPKKPFFMYVNLQNSHVPYRVPEGFNRRFGPKEIDFTVRFGFFPKDKATVVKDLYADSLAYVDHQIGRLLDHLRQLGLWDKTVLVVTGDHGQAFYEHDFAAHGGAIFDEVMKVPLVVRAPELTPAPDDRPAQHIDVPPSVLELLGLPAHPSFQGQSLFSATSGADKPIFMVTQTPIAYQYGVVQSNWKLIYDERQRNYLLFNLAADPGEKTNLAAKEPARLKRLADRLHAWRTTQIKYYNDAKWHTREYPPILQP